MKRYRLKKDLPTFKAGDEFYLSEEGNLVFIDERPLVAYSKQTLEKFPNILEDWFEEIPEEYKRWRAKKGESYWFIENTGLPYKDKESGCSVEDCRYTFGNYFNTREEAINHIDYLIALQTIKDDAKGFVPDWKNFNQSKYHGCYNYNTNSLTLDWGHHLQRQGVIHFKTEEDIKESLNKHRKEWLTVLGVEE